MNPNQDPNNRGQQENQQDFQHLIENKLNSLEQTTTNARDLQNSILRIMANQLISLNNKFDTFNDKLDSIQSSIDSLIGFDERLSISLKFISKHLDDFTWTQIVSFFDSLLTRINQNNPNHTIPPLNRAEKRKKTLFLNHLDIFWDEIVPYLIDPTIQEVRSLILNPQPH